MKTLRMASAILISLLLFSCSTQGDDVESQQELGKLESQQELVKKIRQAVEQKDADAIMKLGYWENVPDSTKEGMYNHIPNCFDYENPSFRIRSMSEQEKEPAEAHGKTYVWNMEPVGYLVIEGSGAEEGSLSIPIGKRDTRYYVATRMPKD